MSKRPGVSYYESHEHVYERWVYLDEDVHVSVCSVCGRYFIRIDSSITEASAVEALMARYVFTHPRITNET